LRRPGISSNVDAIVGRLARVTETIGPHQPGRITIEGEEWRAVLDTTGHDGSPSAPGGAPAALSPGEVVRIVRIDGVTAHVATAASPPPPDPATA